MATSSMDKDFIIKDNAAFEQYQRDLKRTSGTSERHLKTSPSLEYGKRKLKRFSFRSEK